MNDIIHKLLNETGDAAGFSMRSFELCCQLFSRQGLVGNKSTIKKAVGLLGTCRDRALEKKLGSFRDLLPYFVSNLPVATRTLLVQDLKDNQGPNQRLRFEILMAIGRGEADKLPSGNLLISDSTRENNVAVEPQSLLSFFNCGTAFVAAANAAQTGLLRLTPDHVEALSAIWRCLGMGRELKQALGFRHTPTAWPATVGLEILARIKGIQETGLAAATLCGQDLRPVNHWQSFGLMTLAHSYRQRATMRKYPRDRACYMARAVDYAKRVARQSTGIEATNGIDFLRTLGAANHPESILNWAERSARNRRIISEDDLKRPTEVAWRLETIHGLVVAGAFDKADCILEQLPKLPPDNIPLVARAARMQAFVDLGLRRSNRSFDAAKNACADLPYDTYLLNQALMLKGRIGMLYGT
jgi:hypothetical protein